MKFIAVSQRAENVADYDEWRDSIDRRWVKFLDACEMIPLLIPNDPKIAESLAMSVDIAGVLLSGGNDLLAYGGNSPERDATEKFLLEYSIYRGLPLLGVCRGMQVIQDYYGVRLDVVEGHRKTNHALVMDGIRMEVNSYHRLGSVESSPELEVCARSQDGVIEAIRHNRFPLHGVMWHPERTHPLAAHDVDMVKKIFR